MNAAAQRLGHVVAAYSDVIRSRRYFPLWLGQLVSNFGDTLHYIALVVLVFQLTGRGVAVAGLVAAYMLGKRHGYGTDNFSPYDLSLAVIGTGLLCVSTLPIWSFKNFKVPRENLLVQEKALKLADESLKRSRRELELGAISSLEIYQPEAQFANAQIFVTQARFRGRVLALGQAGGRHRRCRNIELRPAESLHANGENDRLSRALRLVHQPVELLIALMVDLVPVRAQTDDAEMHGLEPGKGRTVIQPHVGGPMGIEADPDLHGRNDLMRLSGRGLKEVERRQRQERHQEHDRHRLDRPSLHQRLDPG